MQRELDPRTYRTTCLSKASSQTSPQPISSKIRMNGFDSSTWGEARDLMQVYRTGCIHGNKKPREILWNKGQLGVSVWILNQSGKATFLQWMLQIAGYRSLVSTVLCDQKTLHLSQTVQSKKLSTIQNLSCYRSSDLPSTLNCLYTLSCPQSWCIGLWCYFWGQKWNLPSS